MAKRLQKHYKRNSIGYFGNKWMSHVTERYNLSILIDFSANKTKIRNFTTENEGCMPAHIIVLAKKYFKNNIKGILFAILVIKEWIMLQRHTI